MTAHEAIQNGNIRIDFDIDVSFGSRIADSVRYPTLSFALVNTDALDKMVDADRAELGYLPMYYPLSEGMEYDGEGWYDFSYGLNGLSEDNLDGTIAVLVYNAVSDDNECTYYYDIPYEDRLKLRASLNNQLVEHFGKNIEELLEMAAQEECIA